MIASSVISRSRELFPDTPQGKLSLSSPWGIPYLFSYENKARNLFQGLRARCRAHLKFAPAPEALGTSLTGVVNP